ncbi:MAG: hypothetical protein JWQ25_422 [Daejeonella sp.]|nr:hypothetical protein [Daejeonella sp.]
MLSPKIKCSDLNYLIETIIQMKLFTNNKIYTLFQFDKEADFEREVVINSKQFFGANSGFGASMRREERGQRLLVPNMQ